MELESSAELSTQFPLFQFTSMTEPKTVSSRLHYSGSRYMKVQNLCFGLHIHDFTSRKRIVTSTKLAYRSGEVTWCAMKPSARYRPYATKMYARL